MRARRSATIAVLAVSVALVWPVVVSGPDLMIGWLTVAGSVLWVLLFAVLAERRQWRFFAAMSVVPVAALCLGAFGVPGTARIALSEDAIVEAAAAVRAGDQPARAGLFRVRWSHLGENDCVIFVTQTLVFNEYGVAHCPNGVDPDDPHPELFHSVGDIYRYEVNS